MSLWNPFTRRADGTVIQPAAPPALRAVGGPLNEGQLREAQGAFYKFCSAARVSAVPNPVQTGRLSDGSPYRIVDVNGVRTMTVWPTETSIDSPAGLRGIGLTTGAVNAKYFVVTYRNKAWVGTAVSHFYGGSGVWVSRGGKHYFTDDTAAHGANASGYYEGSARKYGPGAATSQARGSATVLRGLAYAATNHGFGVITPGGKYVQVAPNVWTTDLSADVAEVAVVPPKTFAETPDQFGAYPVAVTTVAATPPDGVNLVQPLRLLMGRAAFSRPRSGTEVFAPLVQLERPTGVANIYGDWLSPLALTHELRVAVHPEYVAEVIHHGDVDVTEFVPEAYPSGGAIPWRATIRQTGWLAGTPSLTTLKLVLGAGQLTVDCPDRMDGFDNRYDNTKRLLRVDRRTSPVYVARDWADAKVSMSAARDLRHEITATTRGREVYDYVFNDVPPSGIWASQGTWYDWSPSPGTEFNYVWTRPGRFRNEGGRVNYGAAYTTTTEATYKDTVVLSTPWGPITLVDVDTKTVMRYRYTSWALLDASVAPAGGNESEEKKLLSVSGRDEYKVMVCIDPILSVVAYIEFATGGYQLSDLGAYTRVRSVGSSASFVVLHRGEEIMRHAVTTFTEGVRISYGDELDGARTARPNITSSIHTSAARVIDFSAVVDDDHYNSFVVAGHYWFNSGFFNVAGETSTYYLPPNVTDGVVPRPTLPLGYGAYSVKTAIDPNSGGGVVAALNGGQVLASWAIAPNGARTELGALLSQLFDYSGELPAVIVSV